MVDILIFSKAVLIYGSIQNDITFNGADKETPVTVA